MKKILIVVSMLILLTIGCSEIMNPDSGLNQTANALEQIAPGVGIGLSAFGGPVGVVGGLIATITAVMAGVYNNWRKKLVIVNQADNILHRQAQLQNLSETVRAVISAIEGVGEIEVRSTTIGNMVKAKVTEELKSRGMFDIGKAIITELKQ